MRVTLLVSLCTLLLISCGRVPFDQWNSILSQYEYVLDDQMKSSAGISESDVFLFNGVYNATRNKDAQPYPLLKKNAENIESASKRVSDSSQERLDAIKYFRTEQAHKPLTTLGSQLSNYKALIAALQDQEESNNLDLSNLIVTDAVFDSICAAHKIKALAMLDFEVRLSEKMNELESDFDSLKVLYDDHKRDITSRTDPRESMTAINKMKQKVRQLDNEFYQISNLYSRISSLRADAVMFQGPFIDEMSEVKSIRQKDRKISGLLSELEKMVTDY
jgi:hypothetical protein